MEGGRLCLHFLYRIVPPKDYQRRSSNAFRGLALLIAVQTHFLRALVAHVSYSDPRPKGALILQQTFLPSHIPKSPISPPLPAPPPAVFCIRPIYCLLTVFHAAIYFSIHVVKHFSSLDDSEVPGVGMHFSKQWLFIF